MNEAAIRSRIAYYQDIQKRHRPSSSQWMAASEELHKLFEQMRKLTVDQRGTAVLGGPITRSSIDE